MKVKSENTIVNTSPNPSKGGEQAVRKMNVRKQLPLFWRGLGGGASELPFVKTRFYLVLHILTGSTCRNKRHEVEPRTNKKEKIYNIKNK